MKRRESRSKGPPRKAGGGDAPQEESAVGEYLSPLHYHHLGNAESLEFLTL